MCADYWGLGDEGDLLWVVRVCCERCLLSKGLTMALLRSRGKATAASAVLLAFDGLHLVVDFLQLLAPKFLRKQMCVFNFKNRAWPFDASRNSKSTEILSHAHN